MKTKQVMISAYSEEVIGDARLDMSVQCLTCKHLHNDMTTCKAFPEGIPVNILTGHWDHTKPYKGDNGIRFEKFEGQ